MTMKQRAGLSLFEVIIVISIFGIVAAILLPAIQAVRESARRAACQNNLRQLSLAALSYESAHGLFPGPEFDAMPNSPSYRNDRGLFTLISAHLEFAVWPNSQSTFREVNREVLETTPGLLRCPTAPSPAKLLEIAEYFSGSASKLTSQTCDYTGNGGSDNNRGTIGGRIAGSISQVRPADVFDGLSNTLLFWESVGGITVYSRSRGLVYDEVEPHVPEAFRFIVGEGLENVVIVSRTKASSKSYLLSWAGLRVGNVGSADVLINETNQFGRMYSAHAGGVNVSRADGSVYFLDQATDRAVVVSLAANGDGK